MASINLSCPVLMNRKLILIGFLMPLFSTAQVSYPAYEEVVQYCYSHYPGKTVPTFRLIKHPDGYQVVFSEDQPPVPVWSPERKWLSLPPVDWSDSGSSIPVEVFDTTEIRNYVEMHLYQNAYVQAESDRLPYYGYRGYYKDVIRMLEPSGNQLTDSELHSLARAYSAAAAALLHDNSNLADSTELFRLTPGRGVMSEQQIQQYRLAQQKAVETYERLLQHNPDFPTPVGTVRVKYANEIMDGYLHLLYFQGQETAKVMLKKGIYEPEFLSLPRNILKSCPPNAVLITYGDTDTYTMLYLQAVEQVRIDVRIVNTSLLALPRYAQYVYDGSLGQLPLQRLLPDVYFRERVFIEKTEDRPSGPVSARLFLENLADVPLQHDDYGYEMAVCPVPTLELPTAPADQALPGTERIIASWKSGSSRYLTLASVVPLDIITANHWSIPLCFAPTCTANVLEPWQGHLILEGMVFRLVPHRLKPVNWTDNPVNLERSFQLFKDTFQFSSLQHSLREEDLSFHQHWLLIHPQVVRELIRANRVDEAISLADMLNSSFTETMAPRGSLWIPLVEQYAQCGRLKSARTLAKQITDNFSGGKLNDYEMGRKTSALKRLNELALQYRFSIR